MNDTLSKVVLGTLILLVLLIFMISCSVAQCASIDHALATHNSPSQEKFRCK